MLSSVYLTGSDVHIDPRADTIYPHNNDWRSLALTKLQRYGFKVVNPLEFAWSEPGLSEETSALIDFSENADHRVQRSLELIDQCDALLANLNRSNYGTPMEIFYAHRRGKVVAVVGQPPFSPWVLSHSQARFGDVERALEYIIDEQPHFEPVQWALQYEALLAERYEELPQAGEPDYKFSGGELPMLVIAPHATAFFRDGEFQEADDFTGSMAAMLNRLSGCHSLTTNYCCVADPMSYLETPFCRALADIVKAGQIGFVLILLGSPRYELPGLQIQGEGQKAEDYIAQLKLEMLSLDKAASSEYDARLGHLPRFISEELETPTLVLRINKRYRMPRLQPDLFWNLVNSVNKFLMQTGTELVRGKKLKMTDAILVILSCREEEAQSIVQPLIEEKLAACISVIPAVKSMYIWQGKFCQEQESLLFIKTNSTCWPNLEKRIKELHTYSIPEILAIAVEAGHKPYLDWINEMVGKKSEDRLFKKN